MKNFVYAAIAFIGLGNSQTYTIDTQSIKETVVAAKSTVTNVAKAVYQKNKALCHIAAGLGLLCVTIATLPAYGPLFVQGKEMDTRASMITTALKIPLALVAAAITSASAYFGVKNFVTGLNFTRFKVTKEVK